MKVIDIINNSLAVSSGEGEKVFSIVADCIDKDEIIELDFSGIDVMTTAFLNSAIGQLYSKFNSDQLNKYLRIVFIDDSDKKLVHKVIKRAKEYFANKEGFSSSAKSAVYGS